MRSGVKGVTYQAMKLMMGLENNSEAIIRQAYTFADIQPIRFLREKTNTMLRTVC
jgi:hypothetical protein